MLVYKALYRKMMDDLKDAGMWIDWAEQLKTECPETAHYLLEAARDRLDEDFTSSYEHFKEACEAKETKGEICMDDIIRDHMMEWRQGMKVKIEHLME